MTTDASINVYAGVCQLSLKVYTDIEKPYDHVTLYSLVSL